MVAKVGDDEDSCNSAVIPFSFERAPRTRHFSLTLSTLMAFPLRMLLYITMATVAANVADIGDQRKTGRRMQINIR